VLATVQAVSSGAWRDGAGRALLAVAGIACGVALGAAVHLINATARHEFEVAARALAGVADLVVRGPRHGFDEALYPRIARLPGIAVASPAVEIEATLADTRDSIRVLGLDIFRAALVQPRLAGPLAGDAQKLLGSDAVWLTQAAANTLGLAPGGTLRLRVGTRVVPFEVAAILPSDVYPEPLAVADIAIVQWRLAQLGRLQRIDLRLLPGADVASVSRELKALLPPGVELSHPDLEASRASAMTRAYRLNLDMLALVALFTGAFLVFSTQFLALMRRRTQFALLRVLGVRQRVLRRALLLEGALLGVVGAAFGVLLAHVAASYVVQRYGVDLGAGYFREQSPDFRPQWTALGAYFLFGVVVSMLGAAPPAFEVSRRPPALALRAGDEQDYPRPPGRSAAAATLIVMGLLSTALPPVAGVPWGGYAGIGLLLLGTIMLLPSVATRALRLLPSPRLVTAALAFARAQHAPRQASITVAAIVASLSLMVSMIVMVTSFRASLDTWLQHMLPADVYLRAAPAGDTGFLTAEQQDAIAATPGIARIEFIRSYRLYLRPDRPPLTLLAREIDPARAGEQLVLRSENRIPAPDAPPPVWISEPVQDVYGWRPGDVVRLPLAGAEAAFTVAGVWRDYARQTGALIVERQVYVRLTGDRLANDAAIWLESREDLDTLAERLHARLGASEALELNRTAALRARSLALFDRTFAVTYGLEAVAILIGLFGVSAAFSAQALARRREYGVLRHLGMTRRQIAAMLGAEGALLATFGAAVGLALGCVIGLILIHVINRQSFHWSMDLHLPVLPLAALAAVLVAASSLVAVWSGRYAMRDEAARAVREDW
jgi:putative ABC transport system permease protein